MRTNVIIKEATPEDAKQITYVRRKTWLTTYPNRNEGITKEDIEASFAKRTVEEESEARAQRIADISDTHIWVAKERDILVGFIEAMKGPDKDDNKIRSFYILSQYQHQGIGTALMEEALKWLGGEKQVSCEVASYNKDAIRFYKKFGFEENGPTTNSVAELASGAKISEIEMVKYPIV